MCDRARLRLVKFVLTQHTAFRYFSQALLQCQGFSVIFFRPYNFTIVSTETTVGTHFARRRRAETQKDKQVKMAAEVKTWSESDVIRKVKIM